VKKLFYVAMKLQRYVHVNIDEFLFT